MLRHLQGEMGTVSKTTDVLSIHEKRKAQTLVWLQITEKLSFNKFQTQCPHI